MHVLIEDMCDGFAIIVDGVRYDFSDEDCNRSELVDVIEAINGDADVEYNEVY